MPAPVAIMAAAVFALGSPLVASAAGRAIQSPATLTRSEGPTLGVVECPACDMLDTLNAESFSRPTRIDGKWLPLVPGTQFVLQGTQNRGGGPLPHNVIFTVTNLVKRIGGIPCVVVWDRDINEGELRESELAFFAQDDDGNVWNTGEYPEEYEQGTLLGAENTWIHGVEWANAGVTVQRKSRLGSPGYLQARAPENDFWDCGLVYSKSKVRDRGGDGDDHGDGDGDGGKDRGKGGDGDGDRSKLPPVCVPAGCFKDWLVIQEWAPLDGCNVIQLKTYAKGVGVVRVGAIDDPEGETLSLLQVNHLSPEALNEASRLALELDTRGYTINQIYATTEPAFFAPPRHRGDDDDSAVIGDAPVTPILPLHTFLRIGPNPVTNTAAIAYSVTQTGMVELSIYDVAGRRVRSLAKGITPAGTYRIEWDARDDSGSGVAAGVYFARLRTPAQAIGKTIVIAK
jgi:hypothetical protein